MHTSSIRHIKHKAKRKTNPIIVETINVARKNKYWKAIAHKISGSTRNHSSVNLDLIDSKTKAGDTVVIIGKILSSGHLSKKVRICALSISNSALEKVKKAKSDFVTILEEINKNPKAEGVTII